MIGSGLKNGYKTATISLSAEAVVFYCLSSFFVSGRKLPVMHSPDTQIICQ